MIRKITFTLAVFLAIAFLMLGCSSNPVTPQVSDEPSAARGENQETGSTHSCLGYYELVFDTANGAIDVLPLRTADWRFNVVTVLNGTMGISAAGVPSEADPPNGLFVFDITLEHPFATKPQFSGFDVKGILMTPGSLAIGTLMFARASETRLENADGYTRWWNPTEFTTPGWFGYTKGNLTNTPGTDLTATVNPYKLFADILGPTDNLDVLNTVALDDDEGRGVFRAGSSNTRRYYIRFPMNPGPVIKYGYAVDVSWLAPVPNPPTEIPDDFPIEANQPEAYRISNIDVVNSLYYDAETGSSGGYVRIYAGVRDWQGEESSVKFQIEQIRAYAPGLISGSVDCPIVAETAGQAFFEFEPDALAKPTKAGDVLIMTRVESLGGPSYDQGFAPAPTGPISAWNVTRVNVEDPDCVADSNNAIGEAETVELFGDVTGNLCFTEDQADYYTFEIPPGYKVSGPIFYEHYAGDPTIDNLSLLNSDGVLVACSQANPDSNSIFIESDNTFMLPGTYYIEVKANQDTGAFKYLLETQLTLTSTIPSAPVDITPPDMDCYATWVNAWDIGSWTVTAAGPAGTFSLNANYLYTNGKIRDTMNFQPAYYSPCFYYVENNTDNPAGVDMDDYTISSSPVHHEDIMVLDGNVRAMAIDSTRLYIAVRETTNTYVYMYDWAPDPANPVFIDKFQVFPDIIQIGILNPGTTEPVLVTMNPHNICIYDAADPHDVPFLDFVVMPDNFWNTDFDIDTADDYVVRTYIDIDDTTGHMQVLRLSATNDFTNIGVVNLTGLGSCVTTYMSMIYVENGTKGITCYRIMGPFTFEEHDSVQPLGFVMDMDLRSSRLCTAEAAGPQIYNVDDWDNISLSVKGNFINCPLDGFSTDGYSYFIDTSPGYSALKVLKTPGPGTFIKWEDYVFNGSASSIANYGTMVIVGSMSDNDIWLFDISNPDAPPDMVYTAWYNSHVTSVAIKQDAAYVALENGTMKILDLSAFPTVTPAPDGSFPGELWNLQITGDYLVGTNIDDVRIFDVSDPLVLFYVGDHDYGGDEEIKDLALGADSYLYFLTEHELGIIKFESISTLTDESLLPISNSVTKLAVDWSYAYLMCPTAPPEAVCVFPPDAPSSLGNTFGSFTGHNSWGISVHDDYLYYMHYFTGLQIFDLY